MRDFRFFLTRFLSDRSGATAVEYELILAGLAVTIFAALSAIGTNIASMFTSVSAIFK